MAQLLFSTLLALYLGAHWTDEAAAWEAALQDAMEEIDEFGEVPPDPTEVSEHKQPATGSTAGEEQPLAQPIALGGSGAVAIPERSNPHARLVALVARAQAVGLSVPLPDGMSLDLSVTVLDNYALDIEELELPLPPRM